MSTTGSGSEHRCLCSGPVRRVDPWEIGLVKSLQPDDEMAGHFIRTSINTAFSFCKLYREAEMQATFSHINMRQKKRIHNLLVNAQISAFRAYRTVRAALSFTSAKTLRQVCQDHVHYQEDWIDFSMFKSILRLGYSLGQPRLDESETDWAYIPDDDSSSSPRRFTITQENAIALQKFRVEKVRKAKKMESIKESIRKLTSGQPQEILSKAMKQLTQANKQPAKEVENKEPAKVKVKSSARRRPDAPKSKVQRFNRQGKAGKAGGGGKGKTNQAQPGETERSASEVKRACSLNPIDIFCQVNEVTELPSCAHKAASLLSRRARVMRSSESKSNEIKPMALWSSETPVYFKRFNQIKFTDTYMVEIPVVPFTPFPAQPEPKGSFHVCVPLSDIQDSPPTRQRAPHVCTQSTFTHVFAHERFVEKSTNVNHFKDLLKKTPLKSVKLRTHKIWKKGIAVQKIFQGRTLLPGRLHTFKYRSHDFARGIVKGHPPQDLVTLWWMLYSMPYNPRSGEIENNPDWLQARRNDTHAQQPSRPWQFEDWIYHLPTREQCWEKFLGDLGSIETRTLNPDQYLHIFRAFQSFILKRRWKPYFSKKLHTKESDDKRRETMSSLGGLYKLMGDYMFMRKSEYMSKVKTAFQSEELPKDEFTEFFTSICHHQLENKAARVFSTNCQRLRYFRNKMAMMKHRLLVFDARVETAPRPGFYPREYKLQDGLTKHLGKKSRERLQAVVECSVNKLRAHELQCLALEELRKHYEAKHQQEDAAEAATCPHHEVHSHICLNPGHESGHIPAHAKQGRGFRKYRVKNNTKEKRKGRGKGIQGTDRQQLHAKIKVSYRDVTETHL